MTGDRESRSPRVSVLMAARNEESRIGRSVESILGQTFRDLELIVADDGSTDDTPRILSEFAARDDRMRILRSETAQGLAHSLNRCAADARGEYLARMDADDVALSSRLEAQLAYLEFHPEVDVLGTFARTVDGAGMVTGTMSVETDHGRMVREIFRRNPFIHPSVVMRKAAFDRLGGYDETLPRCQDYDLWLRARRSCRFANLGEPFLFYRVTPAIRWDSLLCSVRVKCRAIRRERLPAWYYWYALRSLLAVPLACVRHLGRR